MLLLESGYRFHTTAFEWPKNMAPSGFSMKLRKHLKNKRLEKFVQLELDRIVDLQFGMNEAAYHVIVELYDRGNIILTDHEMTILNILRPHVEGEEVRFAVREKYPESRAKESAGPTSIEALREILSNSNPGDYLKKCLNPVLGYGPSVIDHLLTKYNLTEVKLPEAIKPIEPEVSEVVVAPTNKKNKKSQPAKPKKVDPTARIFNMDTDLPTLWTALVEAETMMKEAQATKSKVNDNNH